MPTPSPGSAAMAVVGVAAGLFGSSFGLLGPWLAAVGIALGAVMWPKSRSLLITLAVAVAAGAAAYLALGLLSEPLGLGSPGSLSGGS